MIPIHRKKSTYVNTDVTVLHQPFICKAHSQKFQKSNSKKDEQAIVSTTVNLYYILLQKITQNTSSLGHQLDWIWRCGHGRTIHP